MVLLGEQFCPYHPGACSRRIGFWSSGLGMFLLGVVGKGLHLWSLPALPHNSPLWNVHILHRAISGSFLFSFVMPSSHTFWGAITYPEPVISSNNVWQTRCQLPKLWYYRHCCWRVNSLPGLSLSSEITQVLVTLPQNGSSSFRLLFLQ